MRIKEQITDGTYNFYRFLAYRRYYVIYMFIIIYLRDYLFMHARSVRKEFMKTRNHLFI